MTDLDIFQRINSLSEEEERLYENAGGGTGLGPDERGRLDTIKVELDRCFDLLNQRQARRAAGLNPDDARPRPAEVVEDYEQ